MIAASLVRLVSPARSPRPAPEPLHTRPRAVCAAWRRSGGFLTPSRGATLRLEPGKSPRAHARPASAVLALNDSLARLDPRAQFSRHTKMLPHRAFCQRRLTKRGRPQRRTYRPGPRPSAGVFDKAGINEEVKGARNGLPQTHPLTVSPSLIPHEPIANLKDFDASGSPPRLLDWRSPGSENRHDRCRKFSRGQFVEPFHLGPSCHFLIPAKQQGHSSPPHTDTVLASLMLPCPPVFPLRPKRENNTRNTPNQTYPSE